MINQVYLLCPPLPHSVFVISTLMYGMYGMYGNMFYMMLIYHVLLWCTLLVIFQLLYIDKYIFIDN